MSKKRLSHESSIDEQTNEVSGTVLQQDGCAKRAKLVSLSDTKLQDLPIELLECILVKAVVMEVKGLKMAKSTWKEKADQVINRLGSVCSQWSSTLTTNYFRNQLHRTLDDTAPETIRLEISHLSRFNDLSTFCLSYAIMKDEIFLLRTQRRQDAVIKVYDRNNMGEVKDAIQLPGLRPDSIAACSMSNCLYILNRNRNMFDHVSILRLARPDEHWSTAVGLSTLINDLYLPYAELRVAANGSLILSGEESKRLTAIRAYNTNGSLQQKMCVPSDIYWDSPIIPKSNGHLVLVSDSIEGGEAQLTEMNMDGTVIRQYRSSLDSLHLKYVSHEDKYGRVLLADSGNRIELLDSEFNLMEVTCTSQRWDDKITGAYDPFELQYHSERNELVAIVLDRRFLVCTTDGVLTSFQLKEI